jgi:hypothetical protein
VALTRVLKTAGATLSRTVYVDETKTDVTGNMTVTVTRRDGTVVAAQSAIVASHGTTGVYTYNLPGGPTPATSATWQLDALTVTWTGILAGSAVSLTDDVEVVGGFYFGLAEARGSDASLADPVKYPTATLARTRVQVEQEAEEIMQRAWVPRFRRVLLDGTGTSSLVAPDANIRTLRSAAWSWVTGQALVPVTGSNLSAIVVGGNSVLTQPYGLPWPIGTGNVLLEYEYGEDQPPEEIRQAAMTRLRSRCNVNRSTIPDRVSSYTTSDGVTANTFRLSMPGAWSTGIPEVDAVYARWSSAPGGFA